MDYAIQKWLIGTPIVPIRKLNNFYDNEKTIPTIQTIESKCLLEAKYSIEKYYENGLWDDYKKITNPYEYVYLSWNKRTSRSVSNYYPLSRSYFKMIELWKMCEIEKEVEALIEADGAFYSAHGAEGPGGFIEGCVNMCKRLGIEFGGASAITLYSEDKGVPGWKKASSFLKYNPNVHINYGYDDTGNIMNLENVDFFVNSMIEDFGVKAHLFTADGGFDFSDNYGAQERSVFKLLFAEVILGLKSLAKGGVLIIKCFDNCEQYTLDLLYCVSSLFRTFGVVKPNTSRIANAERYFVGKGFNGFEESSMMIDFLVEVYETLEEPFSFLSNTMDNYKEYKQMMYDIQQIIEKNEYENIQQTLELIKSHDIGTVRSYIRMNVLKSIEWCKYHNEYINKLWSEKIDMQIIQESIELMNLLHPEKQKQFIVNKNVSWFVKSDKESISFEDFGKRRMKNDVISYG